MDLQKPSGGTQGLSADEAKAKGADFLIDDLRQRVAAGGVSFDFNLQLAQAGDNVNSVVTPLPDNRPKVTLGRLTIRSGRVATANGQADRDDSSHRKYRLTSIFSLMKIRISNTYYHFKATACRDQND